MGIQQVVRGGVTAFAGAGAAAIVILGIAAVSWRSQCSGAAESPICGGSAAVAVDVDDVVTGSIGPLAAPVGSDRFEEVLRYEQVIADTFEVLVEPGAIAAAEREPLATEAPKELAVRKVSLVAVARDGRPLWQGSGPAADQAKISEAAAASEPVPVIAAAAPLAFASETEGFAPREPAEALVAPIPAQRSVVASTVPANAKAIPDVAREKPAAAPDTRTVLGQGVNVRSGPSSSRGKVFALKGGAKVTITEKSKGWLHITDDRGRRGWVYSRYVK